MSVRARLDGIEEQVVDLLVAVAALRDEVAALGRLPNRPTLTNEIPA